MATRAQLLATAKTNATNALSTSVAAAMTQLKSDMASDPLTAFPAKQPEFNKAIDTIAAKNYLTAAKEFIAAVTAR